MARTALVTGATRGIGRAAMARLAAAGIAVVGIARHRPAEPVEGMLYTCDLADARQRAQVLQDIVLAHRIDIVVNNVGAARIEPTGSVTEDALEEMWSVNVRSAVDVVQAALPGMQAQGWGRIVNVASGALLGKPGRAGYAATKAALVGLTRTLAIDLAPSGITANVVAPGQIRTELFTKHNPLDDPRTIANLASIPARRVGEVEEVAAAIAFFASEEASYVTGQLLYVCGGLTIGKSAV